MGRFCARAALACAAALVLVLGTSAPASGSLATLKSSCQQRDAADNNTGNGLQLPIVFCDDGVPDFGGRTPNVGAVKAVPVPQKYGGFAGLPPKVAADPNTGADPATGDIALDVDVTMPDPALHPPPAGGYPLVAMMHGCCAGDKTGWEASTIDAGGERWHYSNAWFASRGYVVINYTSRGFVNSSDKGSTGETQLDSRRYEVNDFQHLAGQLADDSFFNVDPDRVVATGGSYGGGFSWMALTDPTWKSPGDKDMKLAAVAPKYGWTDLPYSLIPNGTHFDGTLPTTNPDQADDVFGMPKQSIVAGLFLSGRTGIPPAVSAHATFPETIDRSFVCLQSGDPFENNPLCTSAIEEILPEFYADRSAYYQQDFFDRIGTEAAARVPIFSAGTFTDPLFTPIEHRRMVDRILSIVPGYPVQEYHGDYQHFVQNKAKEWGDVCGGDRHVCNLSDYPGGDLDAAPTDRALVGATTRLNAFVDHYVGPQGNPDQPQPPFDVTASLQICPQNADASHPADEPGDRFTAASFDQLAPNTLTVGGSGAQATSSSAPNQRSANSDPLENQVSNSNRCPVETGAVQPGHASYQSAVLPEARTMIGQTRLRVTHTGNGLSPQLNARLYDVFPDGTQVMVDRGVRRITDLNGTTTIPLHGNGWRFPAGHRILIELTQNDAPYVRQSNSPSSLLISQVRAEIPVREASATVPGTPSGPPPPGVDLTAPRFASDQSRDPRFVLGLDGSGDVDHFEIEARNYRSSEWKRLSSSAQGPTYPFSGFFGATYRFRARAVGPQGQRGAWDYATTVIPFDDSREQGRLKFSDGDWAVVQSNFAWGDQLRQAFGAGDTMSFATKGQGKLFLIARTSPSGGRAELELDGVETTVNFNSDRARNRVLVKELRVTGEGRHVLHLRTLSGRVQIDGIGQSTR